MDVDEEGGCGGAFIECVKLQRVFADDGERAGLQLDRVFLCEHHGCGKQQGYGEINLSYHRYDVLLDLEDASEF
ncbi:MAG TPA: hypothetical protein DIS88_07650 [Prevotella sp.]|nr:hypothetical protein [Prevotella sp.]